MHIKNEWEKFYNTLRQTVSFQNHSFENQPFESQEWIPIKLKTNTQHRSLHKFTTGRRVSLRDLVIYHSKNRQPVKILVHSTIIPIKIRQNRRDYDIVFNGSITLFIVRNINEMRQDQYYLNFLISISDVPCIISLEFFYKDKVTPISQLPNNPLASD